jgi:chromosome segregation ATPase
MRVARTLISAIAFSLFFLSTSLVFQPGALAQADNAYQGQIESFASKLEEAMSAQADLDLLAVCLDRRDANLVVQRDELEVRLGQLSTEERDLAPKVQSLEAAYNQYKANFEAAEKNVVELRKSIENMPGRKLYEQQKRDCASNDPWDRMACGRRMGRDIFGHFDKMEAQLNDAGKREQIALGSMNAEKQNLDESQGKLETTRGQLNAVGLEIGRTEKAIGGVKRSISDVREVLQPLRLVIVDFAAALNEAKDVNLADERPRTLRKLNDIAMAIDATMARGRFAVSHADETLGAEWKRNCGVI